MVRSIYQQLSSKGILYSTLSLIRNNVELHHSLTDIENNEEKKKRIYSNVFIAIVTTTTIIKLSYHEVRIKKKEKSENKQIKTTTRRDTLAII